jgi:hypothetical protein
VEFPVLPGNPILPPMKRFEAVVALIILAATVLAIVYRHSVAEMALPLVHSIW